MHTKRDGKDRPLLPQNTSHFKADVALSAFDPVRKRWRIVAVFEVENTSKIIASKKEFLRAHDVVLFRLSATKDSVNDKRITFTLCDVPKKNSSAMALVRTLLQVDLTRGRVRALPPPKEDDSDGDD
jgi:hypothetical protein